MTQVELVAVSTVTAATISKGENGRPVRISTIRKLAAALGVAPAELMSASTDAPQNQEVA